MPSRFYNLEGVPSEEGGLPEKAWLSDIYATTKAHLPN